MKHKKLIACGTTLLVTLALGSTAIASGAASVTVRVEGLNRSLLAPTSVKIGSGSLTRFGAPSGKCPDASAAGALDAATHHNWKGTWESSFGDYEVTSILGETHTFASKKDYWEIFVNNRPDQTGACESKLKPGERVVFAAVPQTGPAEGLLVIVPTVGRALVGRPVDVTVQTLHGHSSVDVAGVHLTGGGANATTNARGKATIRFTQRGNVRLQASKGGFVRGIAGFLVS